MEIREMSVSLWKGMLDVVYSCEDAENPEQDGIPEKIKILRNKLQRLEECKNVEDAKEAFQWFTEEEINYLNSSLLDEIHKSILRKNPLFEACQCSFVNAVKFYLERMERYEVLYNHLFITSSVEIMRLLLEKNPELEKYKDPLFKVALKLQNVEIAKTLYIEKTEDKDHVRYLYAGKGKGYVEEDKKKGNYSYLIWNSEPRCAELLRLLPDYLFTETTFPGACSMTNNLEILKIFESRGFNLLSHINSILVLMNIETLKHIVENYTIEDPEIKQKILKRIIKHGEVEFLKYLLNKGFVFSEEINYFSEVSFDGEIMIKFLSTIKHLKKNSKVLLSCLRKNILESVKMLYEDGIRLNEADKEAFLRDHFFNTDSDIIDVFVKYEDISTSVEIFNLNILESGISSASLKHMIGKQM